MTLREGGIYMLPNGTRLLVSTCDTPGILFRLRSWYHSELTEFEINEAGRLLAHGRLTAWDIQHLQDTGETI